MERKEDTAAIDFTIDEKLILVKETVKTPQEIIKKLGSLLYDNGFVQDSYTQAVLEREKVFPTGLKAKMAGVAIPHTDTGHVIKPAIAIATLENPITFHMMGTPDEEVAVEIVIMLAVHDAKLVIPVLRKVIFILENDEAIIKMKSASSKKVIRDAMIEHIESLAKKGV